MPLATRHLDKDAPRRQDAQLFAAASGGDTDAFRIVFDRHAVPVRAYVAARLGPIAADDVVIETFEVAWRRRASFRADADSARPWLLGIATRLIQAHAQAEQRWQRGIQLGGEQDAEADVDQSLPASIDPVLVRALAALTPAEREVLVLVALGELSVVEAARATGVSAVAARVRLHRARRAVATSLQHGSGGRHDAADT